jgi:uncharacterized protein (TIGR02646 family)
MKFINKNPEPIEFIKWKNAQITEEGTENMLQKLERKIKEAKNEIEKRKIGGSIWSELKGEPKTIEENVIYYSREKLWDKLLLEQGHLCAYCGKRLGLSDRGRIDHVESKSENPELTFEYTNLVAVCDGQQYGDGSKNAHCDRKKADLPLDKRLLLTKPDNKKLHSLFSYSSYDGEMTSTDTDLNDQIKDVVGLNVNLLKEQRLDILKNLITWLDEAKNTRPNDNNFLKAVIEEELKDIFSKTLLEPYCFVKENYLSNQLRKV